MVDDMEIGISFWATSSAYEAAFGAAYLPQNSGFISYAGHSSGLLEM